ncbi:MAG: stage III sporulation AC/AD family protein [Oscillibacter sp.]|nr:stage III sporulation AC/AD family protein [Oscillibacter sp.]
MVQITALCLVGAVVTVLVKKNSPDIGLMLALAVCLAALWFLSGLFGEITAFIRELMNAEGLSSELFSPLVKTVGIAIISRVGSDVCKDAGQASLGSLVEMGGSFCAVLVALPLFGAVWDMLSSLL